MKVEKMKVHLDSEKGGRSFEPLSPHHFSFNSVLGWCPTCEGLGVQMGASQDLLIRDPHASVRDGAIALWPSLTEETPFVLFAEALCRHVGFSLFTPVAKLSPSTHRAILHVPGVDFISL